MKNSLFLLALFASISAYSQVGINTPLPGSTLDVTAKNATGASNNVDGLLVPRVDRQRAQSMTSVPISTMIYVNNAVTGTQTGTTANVDAVGYYYFDGSAWVKLHNPTNSTFSSVNIYNSNGSLTGNRLVQQNANTLSFTGTAVNAFSVDGNTLSVDASNDRIGIGTTAPTNKLHVNGTNPLRLEGLQASSGKVGTLVVNSTGVVQTQTSTEISAVRATGSLTLTSNNVETLTNSGNTPTETFDNLNEFSGATFTAATAGLYKVELTINFEQRVSSNDNGDGYMGYAYIYLNGTSYSQAAVKVANPEISGAPTYQTATTSTLVKMAAGNTLKFYATNYGSSGGNTANYTINIVRID